MPGLDSATQPRARGIFLLSAASLFAQIYFWKYMFVCRGIIQLGDEVRGIDGDLKALPMFPRNFHIDKGLDKGF